MIIILVLVAATLFGMWLAKKQDWVEISGIIISIICGACLFVFLVVIPINRYDTYVGIEKYKQIQKTMTSVREKGNELEGAAMHNTLVDANIWLVDKQYWNNSFFDLWIPDEVDSLEFLE